MATMALLYRFDIPLWNVERNLPKKDNWNYRRVTFT
jgi:hypothetical protein